MVRWGKEILGGGGQMRSLQPPPSSPPPPPLPPPPGVLLFCGSGSLVGTGPGRVVRRVPDVVYVT